MRYSNGFIECLARPFLFTLTTSSFAFEWMNAERKKVRKKGTEKSKCSSITWLVSQNISNTSVPNVNVSDHSWLLDFFNVHYIPHIYKIIYKKLKLTLSWNFVDLEWYIKGWKNILTNIKYRFEYWSNSIPNDNALCVILKL